MRFFIFACLFALPTFAAVKLQMNVTANGETSKPTIVTEYNEKASISVMDGKSGLEISVIAKQAKDQAVALEFEIYEMKEGTRTLVSSPKVTGVLGKPAKLHSEEGANKLELEVLATEI